MSMMDVSLTNILLSPTTSKESSGQPRIELAPRPACLVSSCPWGPANDSVEDGRGYLRVIKSPEQRSANSERTSVSSEGGGYSGPSSTGRWCYGTSPVYC
ncbi:hypothetical protein ATANTOWER_030818 [Ataeniobius toweri]|uniref:Uncharacterized protein n=1 Tax=Ataeniobius toweri TaxID=208326 RepID=A0ABU7BDY0_9TELE|nr:hypothetical protein [Ataeniobius toweri]